MRETIHEIAQANPANPLFMPAKFASQHFAAQNLGRAMGISGTIDRLFCLLSALTVASLTGNPAFSSVSGSSS